MPIDYTDVLSINFTHLTIQQQDQVSDVLLEIQSTPEGQILLGLIQDKHGTVDLTFDPNGITGHVLGTNDLNVSFNKVSSEGYYGLDGAVHAFTLQRVLTHEMFHLADDRPNLDETAEIEAPALQFENEFMAKYYGDTDRRLVHLTTALNEENITNNQLLNPNFDEEGYEGYTFIGKSTETIENLLTDIGMDEFEDNSSNYFYKVIAAKHDFLGSDAITTEYEKATDGLIGTGRIRDDGIIGLHSPHDELDTSDTKVIYGFRGDDTISVEGGARIVYAGSGDDSIVGGDGINNTLSGGHGDDTLSYADTSSAVTVNLANGTTHFSSTSTLKDNITGIENVVGTDFADEITGDSNANKLEGGGGADILIGSGGNDELIGGAGTDTYVVDSTDTGSIIVTDDTGILNIDGTQIGFGFGTEYEGTLESGIAIEDPDEDGSYLLGDYWLEMTGTDLLMNNGTQTITLKNFTNGDYGITLGADQLEGNAIQINGITKTTFDALLEWTTADGGYLYTYASEPRPPGGYGGMYMYIPDFLPTTLIVRAENFTGTSANDLYYGAAAFDGVTTISTYGGNDIIQSNLNPLYAQNVYAGEGRDIISTMGGAGSVYGEDGDDYFQLAPANNTPMTHIYGGNGRDYFNGSNAALIDGGNGVDTWSSTISTATSGISFNARQGSNLNFYQAADDVLVEIRNIEHMDISGTEYNDKIYLSSGNDVIEGRGGNDTLSGGKGSDTLIGGSGSDTFIVHKDATALEIADFTPNTDILELGQFTQVDDFSDITLTQHGVDTLVSVPRAGGPLIIRLVGVTASTLDADDFGYNSPYDSTEQGTSGPDTFPVITNTSSLSLIRDFDILQGDALDISTYSGITNISQINIEADGSDSILTFPTVNGNTATVVLENVNASSIDETYFLSNILNYGAGETVSGAATADTIAGSYGDDIYYANEGDDSVNGHTGNDTLWGWDGNDTLNGSYGQDYIGGDAGADSLVGGGGDDTLYGGDGDDTLDGGDGDDELADDSGSNSFYGGNGDDTITIGGTNGLVSAGDGNDFITISGTGSYTIDGGNGSDSIGFTDLGSAIQAVNINNISGAVTFTATGFEHIIGTNYNDTVSGTSAANNLTGNDGNDSLTGGDGNDTLAGDSGIDTLIGGLGDDLYYVDTTDIVTESPSEGTDTVNSSAATYTLASNVENLTLIGSAQINGNGNILNNVINGNRGTNLLSGGDGNDTIDGGDGIDLIYGDLGADSIIGGSGSDTVNYANSSAGVYVDLANNTVSGGFADGDQLVSIERVYGSNTGADTIFGNAEDNYLRGYVGNDSLVGHDGNDTLEGGAGTDTMIGGLGNDIYYVDASETVTELANEGTDAVFSSITYTLGSYVENLTLTGTANINGAGNSLNNHIIGNSGTNLLNTTMTGGNDTFDGGEGNDLIYSGSGSDSIIGGDGIDTVSYSYSDAGVNVDLSTNIVAAVGYGAGDSLSGIENVYGSNNASTGDNLKGSAGANFLRGYAGSDILRGNGGNDILQGDAGNDQFYFAAGHGTDTINDFVGNGSSAGDVIRLVGLTGLSTWSNVYAATNDVGGNAVIATSGGTITLVGVSKSSLDANDFQFS